nr:MAG TPA: Importin repeat [Caudoviricetes sp.]
MVDLSGKISLIKTNHMRVKGNVPRIYRIQCLSLQPVVGEFQFI